MFIRYNVIASVYRGSGKSYSFSNARKQQANATVSISLHQDSDLKFDDFRLVICVANDVVRVGPAA